MKHIEKILQEKEEEIHQLKQQISSQEERLAQRGVNLPDKTSLLSGIANLVEQLYKAQEEHQQCSLDLTLRSRKALYHQQHAEELTYTMVCGFITVQLPSSHNYAIQLHYSGTPLRRTTWCHNFCPL